MDTQRQLLLERLRIASRVLHDPSLHPANIEPERLERICSELQVSDPAKLMDIELDP